MTWIERISPSGVQRRTSRCACSTNQGCIPRFLAMDAEDPLAPGTEPLYELRANIYQLYLSAFF